MSLVLIIQQKKNAYLNSHLRITANSIIMHPQYDTNTKINDIALIELSRSVDLTDKTIGFICLPMLTLRYPKLFPPDRADAVIFVSIFPYFYLKISSGCNWMGTYT